MTTFALLPTFFPSVGIEFDWLYPSCPPGQIQNGDVCEWCPANTYSDVTGAVRIGGNYLNNFGCKPCNKADPVCESCDPKTGNPIIRPGWCKIDNICRLANSRKSDILGADNKPKYPATGNEQCSM